MLAFRTDGALNRRSFTSRTRPTLRHSWQYLGPSKQGIKVGSLSRQGWSVEVVAWEPDVIMLSLLPKMLYQAT
ncbi:hypothetical protein DSO57_1006593, partial [Entomophthora muscae]